MNTARQTIQSYSLGPTIHKPSRVRVQTSGPKPHTRIISIHKLENELLAAKHPTPYDTQTIHTLAASHLIDQLDWGPSNLWACGATKNGFVFVDTK